MPGKTGKMTVVELLAGAAVTIFLLTAAGLSSGKIIQRAKASSAKETAGTPAPGSMKNDTPNCPGVFIDIKPSPAHPQLNTPFRLRRGDYLPPRAPLIDPRVSFYFYGLLGSGYFQRRRAQRNGKLPDTRVRPGGGCASMLNRFVVNFERRILEKLKVKFASMDEVNSILDELAIKISEDGFNFDLVVGIANKGIYPAIYISRLLKKEVEILEVNRNKYSFCGVVIKDRFMINRLIYCKNNPVLRNELKRKTLPEKILIVDDNCGSGKTFNLVKEYLFCLGSKDISTSCVYCYEGRVKADYVGFDVPGLNKFLKVSRILPWCDVSPYFHEYRERLKSLASYSNAACGEDLKLKNKTAAVESK